MSIHSTAVVDPGAEIGPDVTIGPFSCIGPHTVIGARCHIGPHVNILPFTSIGPECRIHTGAVIGDLPQDTGFKWEDSSVRVGAKCTIREYVTIHRGTKGGTATEIGDGCFLMAMSHCAHNVKLGSGVILANGALLAGYVEVGDRAFISGHCLVHQFTRVGRMAMLSGGAGVSKDVPPFCTARSMSVNRIAGLNVVGMRRGGFAPEQRMELKSAFRLLYRSGLNVTQALERIRSALHSEPIKEFCSFVEASKRGICGYGSDGSDGADEAAEE